MSDDPRREGEINLMDALRRALPADHHTCHEINPPFPYPCKACATERSEALAAPVYPTAIHADSAGVAPLCGPSLGQSPHVSDGVNLEHPAQAIQGANRPNVFAPDAIVDAAYVAGQMDAQATEREKWKIGSGGTIKAMSRQFFAKAYEEIGQLRAENARLRTALEALRKEQEHD